MEAPASETNPIEEETNPIEEEVVQLVKIIVNPSRKIAIDKLDEENFLSWKFQVLVTLGGYG